MRYTFIALLSIVLASVVSADALAQRMPERRLVRKGNRQYERGDYDNSIDNYARALMADPDNFEAKFNTANVQVRKELIDKAENSLRKLAKDSTLLATDRADVIYNLGNVLFIQQRLEDALNCYRDAMRLNPDDQQAKFNYALTKELLKQQQQQQNQNQNDQNQDKNDQNQDKQEQNQNQNQDNQDQNEDKQDQQDQQQQPEQQISNQEQQAMLEAIQAQEDKTQEKLKEKKGVLIRGGKNWQTMEFASPKILWFLLLLIPLVAYYIYRTRQGGASVTVSTTESLCKAPKSWRYYLRHIPFVLRCAALSLIVVAIARPQSAEHYTTTTTEGIDIVLAVDISTSMLAMDFTPDRLSVAKGVAGEFIGNRTGDRIGIVAFAGESFTQSPLTTDTGSLQTMLSRLNCGIIEDGTAIGNGLATALNRLRESD
jgi:flagellar biosynthesis GTPase FlhF